MTRQVLLLPVVLIARHVVTVEVGEIVTPQRIARFDMFHGFLDSIEAGSHLVQNLLIKQFHTESSCQFHTNLVSTCSELSADGDNKFLFLVHSC